MTFYRGATRIFQDPVPCDVDWCLAYASFNVWMFWQLGGARRTSFAVYCAAHTAKYVGRADFEVHPYPGTPAYQLILPGFLDGSIWPM